MGYDSELKSSDGDILLFIDDELISSAQLKEEVDRKTWKWNPKERLLTLNKYRGGCIYIKGNIAISLSENTVNIIKNTKGDAVRSNGKLTIDGDGKLFASGVSENASGINASELEISSGVISLYGSLNGISASSFSIHGGKIQSVGRQSGISAKKIEIINGDVKVSACELALYAENEILISGGVVNANGNFGPSIFSGKNLLVTGGKINTSGTAESDIYAENIRISGGDILSDGSVIDSCIYADDSLVIEGGSIILKSGRFRDMHVKYGVKANHKILISGGMLKTHGYQFGIYICSGGIEISGGNVTSNGNLVGILAEKEIKIIGESVVSVSGEHYFFSRSGKVVVESSAHVNTGDSKKNALYSERNMKKPPKGDFMKEPLLSSPRTTSFSIGNSEWSGDNLLQNITGPDWEWKGHEQILELDGYEGGRITAVDGLNLRIISPSKVISKDNAVVVSGGNLFISGNSELNISGKNGIVVRDGGIRVNDVSLNISGDINGVVCGGDIICFERSLISVSGNKRRAIRFIGNGVVIESRVVRINDKKPSLKIEKDKSDLASDRKMKWGKDLCRIENACEFSKEHYLVYSCSKNSVFIFRKK